MQGEGGVALARAGGGEERPASEAEWRHGGVRRSGAAVDLELAA